MVRQWRFHTGAGSLCLDFANTVSWRRSATPIERLETVADLVSWSTQVGLMSRRRALALRRAAEIHRRRSGNLLREARSLREAIFAVFAALSENRLPPTLALQRLERSMHQAVAASRLERGPHGYHWRVPAGGDLEGVLWMVALSAEALLRSEDILRLGQCAGRDCRWLWIDRTRNQSRRWCDMAVCGNRTKVRRFHQRLTARAS